MMAAQRRRGRVITFYSYKGGTGRSMALANVAWVLAAAGRRVLAIDWDLEAPGLHRYFRPFLMDQELVATDGLMDLIDRYTCEAIQPLPEGESLAPDWWEPLADFEDFTVTLDYPHFPQGGQIDFLPAGRQTDAYALKVNAFNWQNFYDRLGGGGFLEAVKERAVANYDYVLIDSRTGVSDTAGICTVQLPDTLVVCFTYNNQSIKGAAAAAASAKARRKALDEDRTRLAPAGPGTDRLENLPPPYRVLPIPTRADYGERERLTLRQAMAREVFGPLLDVASATEAQQYWSDVEIQHEPFYSYEEVLSPFKDDANDPRRILASFVRIASHVSAGDVSGYRSPLSPQELQHYLDEYAQTPQTENQRRAAAAQARESEEEALTRRAEAALNTLDGPGRALAMAALARLVRLEGDQRLAVPVPVADFPEEQQAVLQHLARAGLLRVTAVRAAESSPGADGEYFAAFADARLVDNWPRLADWLALDLAFLGWRQQLQALRKSWVGVQDRAALLGGTLLAAARRWASSRAADLNAGELAFIEASAQAQAEMAPPTASAARPSMASPLNHPAAPEALEAVKGAPPRSRRWLFAAGAAALGLGSLAVVQWRRDQRLVAIPDLAGKELSDAQQFLTAAGLRWETVDETGKPSAVTRGYVSGQSPDATFAPADTVVKLMVTEALVTVPTLIGLPLQEATNALQSLGLNLKVGDPVVSLSAEARDGVIQSQKPDPGSRLVPNATVQVRQVRLAPQVLIVDAFMAADRAKLWEPRFNAAGFRVGARQPGARSFTPPAVAEVRYFDAAGAADAQKILPTLKAAGIDQWKVIGADGPRKDDGPSLELVLPSPLQKYRVDIIHYDGDRYGTQMAALIARTLQETAFAADVRRSPKPADKLDALYPPRTFEVRYEKGEEEAASYLLAILKTVKEVTRPVMFLVDATPTPEYLSIFIPRQPEPSAGKGDVRKSSRY
jgi:MinD-like ATPase involved in chromosome partitioning or flagellar assembly